jgi:hypothetical protein
LIQRRAEHGPPNGTTERATMGDLRLEQLRLAEEEVDLRAWLEQARGDLFAAERASDIELARRRLTAADNVRRGGAALDAGFSAGRFENWRALIEAMGATRMSHENTAPPPTGQQLRVFASWRSRRCCRGVR